jgi:hypothetical protein
LLGAAKIDVLPVAVLIAKKEEVSLVWANSLLVLHVVHRK